MHLYLSFPEISLNEFFQILVNICIQQTHKIREKRSSVYLKITTIFQLRNHRFCRVNFAISWHFCSLNQIAKLHLSSQICNILILQNYLFDKCYTIQLEFFKTIVSAMFNMLKNIFLLILFIYIHEYVHEINQLLEIYFSLNLKKDSYADRDKLLSIHYICKFYNN